MRFRRYAIFFDCLLASDFRHEHTSGTPAHIPAMPSEAAE